jgi:hypothetical protein
MILPEIAAKNISCNGYFEVADSMWTIGSQKSLINKQYF